MSDVPELITRLRYSRYEHDNGIGDEAADALEAQGKALKVGHDYIEALESRLAAAEEQMKVDRLIVEEARRNEVAAERERDEAVALLRDSRHLVAFTDGGEARPLNSERRLLARLDAFLDKLGDKP